METKRQVGYPAIAKAQRMSAARLGVAPPMARAVDDERMQQRRVQDEDTAERGGQRGEGDAATAPSPWIGRERDTLTAAVAAAAAAAVGKRFGGASTPPLRSHSETNNPTGDGPSQAEPTTTGRRAKGSTATDSSRSDRRRLPAERGRARVVVDISGVSSRSASRSASPLPVAQALRPRNRKAEQFASMEKTVADIVEMSRSVRREAIALDRFLSLELEPAAQQAFDEAVSEHAKARRILEGTPTAAAVAPVAEAVGGDTVASSRVRRRRRDNGGQVFAAGESSAAGMGAASAADSISGNKGKGDDRDTAASTGSVPAAQGVVGATDTDANPAMISGAAAAAAAAATAAASSNVGASVVATATVDATSPVEASDNPTEAWQRAVRAGVIQPRRPPPTHSVRASLPAIATRGLIAADGGGSGGGSGGAAVDRPPIVDFIGGVRSGGGDDDGGGGGGGGGGKECPLRSHRRRNRRAIKNERVERNVEPEEERAGEAGVSGKREKEGPVGEEVAAARNNEPEGKEEEGDDEEADDDGWDTASLHGALQQLTTEISSKMVGLSSLIRGKAAKAAESEGRRKQ